MNEKNMKYELTTNKKGNLSQIRALKNFSDVKKGDLGGFIESESNLSQEDDCWVSGNAVVSGNAKVTGNAKVFDDAVVYEYAQVVGTAKVSDNAEVFE